jgi:hypothetical protein
MRRWVQAVLRRFGYQLVRASAAPERSLGLSHPETRVDPAVRERLRPDHPRLLELRQRYAAARLPMLAHSWWTPEYIGQSLDLAHFRGDNAYVWQTRHMPEAHLRYYLYAQDVAARDALGLFPRLAEDGAFGCWVYRSARFPALSRDVLDSVNELNFLERHAGLTRAPGLNVLDIGAGYGRLAHRSCEALPNLGRYYCTDGVAESTFLSEFYLEHRGCRQASVVPADELGRLDGVRLDLAINVHSFSEMSLAAIDGWLELLQGLRVPRLFVVPNDGTALLSMEADGSRRDFEGALEHRGYRLAACEPAIADADVRQLVGVADHLFLFERRT